MAYQDYNREKTLDVDSVSGTPTVDKATPVIVEGDSYNISTASFSQSISTQDGSSSGIAWNDDGSKLYEVGGGSDLIYEYDVSTPYDISTATFSQSISTQDSSPRDIIWNNDGSKLYEVGDGSQLIYEYDVSTPFDISTATFSQSISTQDGSPSGIVWNNDGSKLYEVGFGSDSIYEYDVSTPFDISTATFSQSINTEDAAPRDLAWNDTGSKLIVVDSNADLIYEYGVSTAYDISTAVLNDTIATQDGISTGVTWNNDGSKLYEVGFNSDLIYEFDVPTEGTTGNGDIIIDFTNISAESDLAVYDQNDNLLPYEIEDFDATAETAVLWVYDSWARDGTTQAKVVYGDGPASSEEGTASDVWGNTGQNAELVQHLNESNYPSDTAIDSSTNGNDGDVTGANSVSAEFDGGADFDGVDDMIQVPETDISANFPKQSTFTIVAWAHDIGSTTSTSMIAGTFNSGTGWRVLSNNDEPTFQSDSDLIRGPVQTTMSHFAGTYDDSDDSQEFFLDAVSQGTQTSVPSDPGVGFTIGREDRDENELDGIVDAVRVYTDVKSDDWVQADYDASPKGGQTFFSQNAAQDTTTVVNQTVSDSLNFAENQSFKLVATVGDTLGFAENEETTLIDTLNDNLAFTENLQSVLIDTLTDQLDFTEAQAFTLIDTLSDELKFTDQTLFGAIGVVASDNLTFGENLDARLEDTLSDQLQFQEQLASAFAATVSDQLQFQENLETAVATKLQDSLDFEENVAGTIASTLADQLNFQEQVTAAILIDLDIVQPTEAFISTPNKFAVMESHVFKENDLGDVLVATLEDENGPIDLTGINNIRLVIKDRSDTKVMDKGVTVTDAANGEVEYQWTSGDPIETAGVYRAEFKIVDGAGDTETVPTEGAVTLEIEEEIN